MENNIIYFDVLDSTNIKARELALNGADSCTVVVADAQTAGKGRRGRNWESPAGKNIYMSVLLRPEFEVSKASMLTLVMAYSVANVLKKSGYLDTQIKWPNDLVLSGKKICGILTELEISENEIDHVIVGVGINANIREFPKELQISATSLCLEGEKEVQRKELIEAIVERFMKDYDTFVKTGDLSFMKNEYNDMLVNRNRDVRVLEPGNEYEAVALGINDYGELLVKKAEGQMEAVYAGEVSVRGVYGYV